MKMIETVLGIINLHSLLSNVCTKCMNRMYRHVFNISFQLSVAQ